MINIYWCFWEMYKNFPHAMKLDCARAIPDSLPVQLLEKLPVQLMGHSCEHLQLQTKAMLIQAIACVGRCRMVAAVSAYRPRLCGPFARAFAPVRAGFFHTNEKTPLRSLWRGLRIFWQIDGRLVGRH